MSFLRYIFGRRADTPEEAPTEAAPASQPLELTNPVATPEPAKEPVAPAPEPEVAPSAKPAPAMAMAAPAASPEPAPEPARRQLETISRPQPRAGRVKTRLMSYGQLDAVLDEMELAGAPGDGSVTRPVGWLVIIEGPGTGGWYTLESGVASIGRGRDQTIRMNYGDDAISRSNHASVAYEPLEHRFRLGAGTSANDVLLNGEIVRGSVALSHGDRITVGETTLRLAAFCDDRFSWAPIIDRGSRNALSA